MSSYFSVLILLLRLCSKFLLRHGLVEPSATEQPVDPTSPHLHSDAMATSKIAGFPLQHEPEPINHFFIFTVEKRNELV